MLYIYIYNLYIYIIFFWLGLFLIKSHKMVASPSPVHENEMEGRGGRVFLCPDLEETVRGALGELPVSPPKSPGCPGLRRCTEAVKHTGKTCSV